MTKEILLLDKTESFIESALSDAVTFSFLLLCIYVSQGSTWWTFFTTTVFIAMSAWQVSKAIKKKSYEFKSLDELKEWIAKQEGTKDD